MVLLLRCQLNRFPSALKSSTTDTEECLLSGDMCIECLVNVSCGVKYVNVSCGVKYIHIWVFVRLFSFTVYLYMYGLV